MCFFHFACLRCRFGVGNVVVSLRPVKIIQIPMEFTQFHNRSASASSKKTMHAATDVSIFARNSKLFPLKCVFPFCTFALPIRSAQFCGILIPGEHVGHQYCQRAGTLCRCNALGSWGPSLLCVWLGRPRSRMWCPHVIGRDNWVWIEQETLCKIIPPTRWGRTP